MGLGYEESKKVATKIITVLAVITIVEVLFALAGKGHIVSSWHVPAYIMGFVMIAFSLIKAYLIVYEFMHMKYEVPGLVKSVLLPTFLLVWAIVAFLYEGKDWGDRRDLISDKNSEEILNDSSTGELIYEIKSSELR